MVKRLAAAALILVLLVGAAGLAAWGAWHSAGVRRAVLARLSAVVEQRTGVRVSAADAMVAPLDGRVELLQIRAGVPDAPPFLTVARLTVQVDLASLRRGPLVLRLVQLQGPTVDLSAPLPKLPTGPPATGGTPPPNVEVVRLEVREGTAVGGELPAALQPYLQRWHLGGIELEGSYLGGSARATLQVGDVLLQRPQVGPQNFSLDLHGEATPGEGWRLARAVLRGAGLEAAATGHGSLAPGGAQHASFKLTSALDLLAPELELGGELRLEGELDAPVPRARVRVVATGLSAGAARHLLPAELVEGLELPGTQVDVVASAALEQNSDSSLHGEGEATVSWRDGTEELIQARLSARLESLAAQAEVDVSLLPHRRGHRRLRGRVSLADLSAPLAARLEGVTLEVEEEEVGEAAAQLHRRWPALVPEVPPGVPLRGALTLRARLDGDAADPAVNAQLVWRRGEGSFVQATATGRARPLAGQADLRVVGLDLAPLVEGVTGTVFASVHLEGTPGGWEARFLLDAARLGGGEPVLDYLHLAGEANPRQLVLHRIAALAGPRVVEGTLRAPLALPMTEAQAQLRIGRPLPGVSEAQVHARLRGGTLEVEVPWAETVTGWAALGASVPLGALGPLLGEALHKLPVARRDGPVVAHLALPELDSCRLAPLLPQLDRPERLRAGVEATVVVDPAAPTGAIGEVTFTHLQVEGNGVRLAEAEQLRLGVDGHRAVLAPVALTAAGTTLQVSSEVSLVPAWRPGVDPPAAAVDSFTGRARGTVEAELLQPYLAGAAAAGPLVIEATLDGTPAAPRAGITVDASGASFFWPTPYAARLEGLAVDAGITAAGDVLFSASGQLNGGRLEVAGSRAADGRTEAQVELSGTRLRLDFGVLVQLDGQLVAELPPEGRSRIHGTIQVARGRLDRPLSLRHELLPFLLAPTTTAGTAGGALDLIDLDIAVYTADGVRVRNNLADLRVRWDELWVRGTAWSPHLEGVVTVDPGGVVRAWGQTLRLDRAVATFTGNPLSDPQLELSVTSSLDDPRVGRAAAGALALLEEEGQPAGGDLEAALTVAAASAVGGTIASSLSSRLGEGARVTVEPVLVFGEADPSARLTVARDLNPSVAFAISLDLRNAERQTYLLDVHNLPRLPTLTTQVFTNDQGNSGVTVQQTLELGGSRRRDEGPRRTLRRLVLEAPGELPRRLRRSIALARGDALPEGIELDLELELEHQLRQLGYPEADVTVELLPVGGRRPRVDVRIQVVPGDPVAIAFAGEVPPTGAQPLITSLYRPGVWEVGALEEMRRAAVRVWRSLGHLDPTVTVTVSPAAPPRPRTVTVRSDPGQRLEALRQVRVAGVEDDVEEHLLAAFAGTVERMELAAGVPDADRRLTATLATLGYPAARVVGRTLTEGDSRLVVQVDAGPRQRLVDVRLIGATEEDLPALLSVAGVAAGQPARRDHAAAAAVRIAQWYRARGFTDVQVRPALTPSPDDPLAVTLSLEMSPGRAFTVAAVDFAGSPRTSAAVARQVAAVPEGQPLRLDLVREGRRRLLATGLYAAVQDEVVRGEEGTATVRYLLDERPPISLAYGVRWESSQGASAVVDYLDRNLLGRALTFGARFLYESTTQAGRLYLGVPDVWGTGVLSEGFLEQRRRITPGDAFLPELVEDATRFTFQLSRPLGTGWRLRAYGRWQRTHLFERTDFFPLDITLTLPYVGVGAAFDSRDDRVLARRGLLANLDLSGTGSFLGADLAFGRLYAQLASFVPVGHFASRPLTWASSLRLGLARTGAGQELIRSERFFAGGEYSVRGYPTESLGPQEDLGFTRRPLGGEALLVVNQELRLALPLDLTGVVFLDAGGVWESVSGIDLGALALATGLGVRAATPIGVLRLDAAVPLHRRPGDPTYKLYLGFGSAF
jgi:translocation and assembly module TamA